MLKKKFIRKIIATSTVLVAMLLVYLVPTSKSSLKTKNEVEYVDTNMTFQTVYLLDQNDFVARSKIVANNKNYTVIEKAKELLQVLITNGENESSIPSGFKSIIPEDTKIIGIDFKEGLLKVNFSKELLDVKEEYEEKMIEAIIYTLTSINEVDKIVIYVENDILSKLPKTKINLPSTLDKNYGINKEYKITNTNNYQKVTVYYVSEYNNDYYYVPVTKYVNDDRDKIKIIVDELSSSYVYNTNLMSFLNSNTKLLATNMDNGVLDLTFNKFIFNDLQEKEILEEVIYTISLSIKDNYDVEEVNFQVDNQEIYKSVLKTIE